MKEYINVMLPKWKLLLPTILKLTLFLIAFLVDATIWDVDVSTILFIIVGLWIVIDFIIHMNAKKSTT